MPYEKPTITTQNLEAYLRELTFGAVGAEFDPEGNISLFIDIAQTVYNQTKYLPLTIKTIEAGAWPDSLEGFAWLAQECLTIARQLRGQRIEVKL